MPHTPSAKRTLRKNEKRRLQNRAVKSAMRTALKKAHEAIENKSEDIQQRVAAAVSKLDKAGRKNLIHRNKAAKEKSRLMKNANAATASE